MFSCIYLLSPIANLYSWYCQAWEHSQHSICQWAVNLDAESIEPHKGWSEYLLYYNTDLWKHNATGMEYTACIKKHEDQRTYGGLFKVQPKYELVCMVKWVVFSGWCCLLNMWGVVYTMPQCIAVIVCRLPCLGGCKNVTQQCVLTNPLLWYGVFLPHYSNHLTYLYLWLEI